MPEETVKQQYLRAWDYYQQGKIIDARALAYVLLKSEQFEAKWYAHVILSHVEESAAERMQNLKPLLARDPQSAWAGQRFAQLKSELLDEAGRALQQRDFATLEKVLQPILEIAPDDAAASALWGVAQQNIVATDEIVASTAIELETHDQIAPQSEDEDWEEAEYITASQATTSIEETISLAVSAHTQTSEEVQAQLPAAADEIVTTTVDAATPSTSLEVKQSPREPDPAADTHLVWRFPFAGESEIVAKFETYLDDLLAHSAVLSPIPEKSQESLRFARRKKHEAWKDDISTSIFLKPAVLAATDLAEAFLREAHLREAFVTANVFGEICKVLLARSPEQYHETFTRLLRIAGSAFARRAHDELQHFTAQQTTPELQNVREQVQSSCLAPALSRCFDNKAAKFVRETRAPELGQRLLNEICVGFMLERLRLFAESEVEEREAFLQRNLPVVQSLQLAPEQQAELEQWTGVVASEIILDEKREAKALVEEPALAPAEKNIWESHPITTWLTPEELREIVDEFLQADQVQDLVAWLKERIECQPNFFSNCIELARVYEERTREIDKAFEVFRDRLMAQLAEVKDGPWVEKTAKKMLNLCKRHERVDLAQQLYADVQHAALETEFLQELAHFAKRSLPAETEVSNKEYSTETPEVVKTATRLDELPEEKPARKATKRKLKSKRAGLFIDHENLWNGIIDVNRRNQVQLPSTWWEKEKWLDEVLRALLAKAKDTFQRIPARVTVGYWQHRDQASFLPAYLKHKFMPLQPEIVPEYEGAIKNGVDFKLADEIRRSQKQALLAGAPLRQIIIVSGDGDFAHLVSNLVEEEILVQVWSVTKTVNKVYRDLIGSENVVFIDDECLYRQAP